MTVEDLLDQARSTLARLHPDEVAAAMAVGAVLVDIRSDEQIATDGVAPGALRIARNVLEWRCDPQSRWRDPAVSEPDLHVLLLCHEGYQSSLAAATLQRLGLPRATDVIGGMQAWRAAGLPVLAAAP